MSIDRNVNVRVTSSFDGSGLTAAERAAWRLEQRERRLVDMQTRAASEMAAAEQRKAAAVEAANRRQAEAMVAVGRTITIASLAVAAGLALSAKASIEWETAFAGVRKTVDGSDAEIAALEGQLRALARTLPATHTEIAATAEAAGQLGVASGDVARFTRVMIAMGESTDMSADAAAMSIARFSKIMGEAHSRAGALGSGIVALGNNVAATESEILDMSLRLAGAGRTAGLTSGQVLGLAAAMAEVGIRAEAGGTAFSTVMLEINSAVESGSSMVDEFARVAGMSARDFSAAWRQDAGSALSAFVTGLGRMREAGVDTTTVLSDLGFAEQRVSDALRRASLSGERFADVLRMGEDGVRANSALMEEFGKRLETTEAKLSIARNTIKDASIDVGNALTPAVATAADVVANLATGFAALPDPVKQWVTWLGAGASGLGLLTGAALTTIPKLTSLSDTINALHGGSSRLGQGLGATARVLTGPWGLALVAAVAAVGGFLTVLGSMKRSQEEARARTEALSRTFDEMTGQLTEYTREWFVAEAATRGYLDAARTLGIDLGVLVDALMGEADAIREVEAAMARLAAASQPGLVSADEAWEANRALNALAQALGWSEETLTAARRAWADNAEAMRTGGAAADRLGDDIDDATASVDAQTDSVKALIDALDELNGTAQSAEAAEIRWADQLARTRQHVASATRTMDLSTEAGRQNRQVLLDTAQAGQRLAEARLRQTGSEQVFRDAIVQVRDELYAQARALGYTEDEARTYVNALLRIPDRASTTITTPGMREARDMATVLRDRILAIPTQRTVSVTVRQHLAQIPGTSQWLANQAHGGVMESYAGGGLRENHVAQIAPAGTWRVWAEPETGGEAYIPLAPSKRARSMAVLANVADRFGVPVGPGSGSGVVSLDRASVQAVADAVVAGAARVADGAVASHARAGVLAGRPV